MNENPQKTMENPGFDSALSRLQQLVKALEGGELSLEDSLKTFEEGVQLARACQGHLSSAEQRVEQLVRGGDEKTPPEMVPFSGEKA